MKPVYTFTNKKQLNKKQFLDYFERKVFRTIRKYNMLPKDKIIKLKKSQSINTAVLKQVIEKKFKTTYNNKPNFSSENLSQVAENTFENILKGKFKTNPPTKPFKPLYFLSDKEIQLYAKLKNIKGKQRKHNPKIQSLFQKFIKKNQDLEHNVVKALNQLSP